MVVYMSSETKYNPYMNDGYMHLAIHRMLFDFDPANSTNPLILDVLNNRETYKIIKNRISDIYINDVSPYVNQNTATIPEAIRLNQMIILMRWVELINSFIFSEQLYFVLYSEFKPQFNSIISAKKENKKSLIYREYNTGMTIFHVAGKLRVLNRLHNELGSTLGKKIKAIDTELNYILNCYRDFGSVFDDGNELTIPYIEDYNGTYLVDYLTNFVDDLVNGSIF